MISRFTPIIDAQSFKVVLYTLQCSLHEESFEASFLIR